MCGIVAIIRPDGLTDEERSSGIAKMRDALRHRGPDDATVGVFDGWVALGHRRLSIIDVAGSPQPLYNETQTVACVFNGEIYNFQDLRVELESRGHVFRTAGDGETIVHVYEEWRAEITSRLAGMFAFVLFDRSRQVGLAARDRLARKHLL